MKFQILFYVIHAFGVPHQLLENFVVSFKLLKLFLKCQSRLLDLLQLICKLLDSKLSGIEILVRAAHHDALVAVGLEAHGVIEIRDSDPVLNNAFQRLVPVFLFLSTIFSCSIAIREVKLVFWAFFFDNHMRVYLGLSAFLAVFKRFKFILLKATSHTYQIFVSFFEF